MIIDPSHCWLIEIGDNVTLAPNVHILAHDASTKKFLGYTKIEETIIGNNVFIGAGTVVLPGIHIVDNVVVGANSTVTDDLLTDGVYVGSPARKVCSFEDYKNRNTELFSIAINDENIFDESFTIKGKVNFKKKALMKEKLREGTGFVR